MLSNSDVSKRKESDLQRGPDSRQKKSGELARAMARELNDQSLVRQSEMTTPHHLWSPSGEGRLSKMRAHVGPGFRVYFTERGMETVILLAGGDKSTQTKDVKSALKLARQVKEERWKN